MFSYGVKRIWVVSFTLVSLKGHYLHHVNFLSSITSSFAPASQQRIKRLKPTSQLRLKHQSEQFWFAEKNTKGGGALKRPAPLCGFLGSQNSSNCCLSLVFVGFNLLILCWLAGANDEVHSFKFNPNPNF